MNWVEILRALSETYTRACDALNVLDSALGDGDHGTALNIAFREAAEKVNPLATPTPEEVLKTLATTLMNRMGGSAGALYGTLFLRASISAKGKTALSGSDLAAMWQAGLDGVKQRGKAQVGDKTMVDALAPAVEAFQQAINANRDIATAFEQAASAARAGAAETAQQVAKFGRAKFVGERSLGHQDAGAVSAALMFETLRDYWKAGEHDQT